MRWVKIQKTNAQPLSGKYSDWKPLLAIEGGNQCVYCAIRENSLGGIRNFHVEHYRPKSIFKDLINDYGNLFYACPICNTFKSNDWPNEPREDNSIASYPNPSIVDYNTLFEVDIENGLVYGNNVASIYIKEKLFLNRPQLIIERRLNILLDNGKREIEAIRNLLNDISDDRTHREISTRFMELWSRFDDLKSLLSKIPRYKLEDIQRQPDPMLKY